MARGTLALMAGALTLAALTAPVGGAQAVPNGGRISTRSAIPGAVLFDPPLVFSATLPLQGFYLNAKTGMSFVGTGAVLDATSPSFSGLIRNPADQCVGELGGVTAGHQAKWVAALIPSGLSARVRQRSLNAASRSLSVAKCSFATASSASGQRCSAGCSSGV